MINFTDHTNLVVFLLPIGGNFKNSFFHCLKLFYFGKTAKTFTENMNLTRTVSPLDKQKAL